MAFLPLRKRFDSKWIPEPNSGCWLWDAGLGSRGYGQFEMGTHRRQHSVGAHRVSWELHRGKIPEGMFVCHRCDVPSCVNPDHLFLGTPADNTADMMAKGRRREPVVKNRRRGDNHPSRLKPECLVRGEAHHSAKLTADAVRHIRSRPMPGRKLAALYGVAHNTILRVQNGKIWGHIS